MNYRILDNLESLENLNRNDFLELSTNIEDYYNDSNFHGSLIHLAHLFKIIGYEDFPSGFRLINVKANIQDDKICVSNQYNQICYEEDNYLYITTLLDKTDSQKFKYTAKNIIKSYDKAILWKYKLYSTDYYHDYDNYIFDNNCAVSIYNNEIITILKAVGSTHIKETDLIKSAIQLGGKQLECYRSDFEKYIKFGFMPISVCKWEDNRAPKAWLQLNKFIDKQGNVLVENWQQVPDSELFYKRQDIIFFIHTNYNATLNYSTWVEEVGYSNNYIEAKEKRNRIYKELLEVK